MKIANKGIENLKPVTKRSKEEAREISKKGGIRSGEVRRAIFERALNGDTKAFEVIRDTIGEKPKEEVEVKDVTPKWFKE